MSNKFEYILGKQIKGVVGKAGSSDPRSQIFLIFSDGTYYEIYGNIMNGANRLDPGGLDEVKALDRDRRITFERMADAMANNDLKESSRPATESADMNWTAKPATSTPDTNNVRGEDAFKAFESEYIDLNNNLVVPSFRKFCKELDLPFHFWDELPKGSFDGKIALEEEYLRRKAMNLFNKLKPEVVFYKNNIVRYQFRTDDGDVDPDIWPINTYLEKTSDELFYLKKLEERFKKISNILCTLLSFLPFLLVSYLLIKYISNSLSLNGLIFLLGIIAAIFCYQWLYKITWNIPERIFDDGRLKGVDGDLHYIRQKLSEARGSRINPSQKKPNEKENLEEERATMSSNELREIIRRLRAELYMVSTSNY